MIGFYDSLAQTGKAWSAFDNWYDLHKLQFWGCVFAFIVLVFIIVRRKK